MISNLSTKMLLLVAACTSTVEARKFLRSNNAMAVDRALMKDTNIDDYTQIELLNELPMVIVTPPASEKTGEQAITVEWEDVSIPTVS